MEQIQPCPYCGSKRCKIACSSDPQDKSYFVSFVLCDICKASGPVRACDICATAEWNQVATAKVVAEEIAGIISVAADKTRGDRS